MSETPEQKATKLLPCTVRCEVAAYPYSQVISHSSDCPSIYRLAVAAAIREAQGEVEQAYQAGWTAGNEHEDELDAEIARLKADNERLNDQVTELNAFDVPQEMVNLRGEVRRLKAERDSKANEMSQTKVDKCDCWDVHINLDLDRHTCGCPCHKAGKP